MPRKKTPKASSSKAAAKHTGKKSHNRQGKGKEAPSKPKKIRGKPSDHRQPARSLWTWLFVLMIWGGIAGLAMLMYFIHDLPELDGLGVVEKRPSIVIKSHDGVILANYGDLYGEYLTYEDFPKYLIDALRATEDRRFFDHIGIDFIGLARAFYRNWQAGYIVEGGSTITQQLAKNLFLSPERTIKRKVQEVILALWLEQKFTKEEILTLYLNRVYLGAGTYGVDAAAKRYFQKSARDLTLSESAMIVGLLKAPSRYSPTNSIERARDRAAQVLRNMEHAGFISPELVELGMTFPAQLVTYRTGSLGSYYFADWIMERLPNYIGRIDRDLVITTTLDTTLQRIGEEAIETILSQHSKESRVDQGALVSLSADGAIRAMIGGRDYRQSQFNRVTQAKRQPGSSFKLFTYLTALEEGIDPRSIWMDEPIRIEQAGSPPWEPQNYTHDYLGEMSMAYAMAMSVNTIAVQVTETVGRNKVIEMARRLGISSELEPHPSLPLGVNEVAPLEMALAYAHIANDGYSVMAYGIQEIHTPDGELVYRRIRSPRGRVLSSQIAKTMRFMLQLTMEEGTGRGAQISGHPTAGKTGTSQDYRDAWFVGFSDKLVTAVWLGNDDATPTKKVTGGNLPAKTWQYYMHHSLNVEQPDILKLAPPDTRAFELLPWHRPSSEQGMDEEGTGNRDSLWDAIFNPNPKEGEERTTEERGSLWDVLPEGTFERIDGLMKDTQKVIEEGDVEHQYPSSR